MMNGINIDEKYNLTKLRKTEGRDGIGFIADLTKNGKVIDEVANYGDGGATRVSLKASEEKEIEEFAKKFYANIDVDSFCDGIVVNFINDLQVFVESMKSAKRSKKTTHVQVVKECPYLHSLEVTYVKWKHCYDQRVKDHFTDYYKGQPYRVLSTFVG